MPNGENKDDLLKVRIEKIVKAAFYEECKKRGEKPSVCLRELILKWLHDCGHKW